MDDTGGLYEVDRDSGWEEYGLCSSVGGDLWFPARGEIAHTRAAKRICQRCPVKDQCLEQALRNDERFGVWGGFTPKERTALSPRVTAGAATTAA